MTTWTNLRDLKDPDCDSVIKAVRRAKTQEGHKVCVSEIAAKQFKLLCFYTRHRIRTSRTVTDEHLLNYTLDELTSVAQQKEVAEDQWTLAYKIRDYDTLNLDSTNPIQAFQKVQLLLLNIRGCTGVPLAYVIRHKIEVEEDGDEPPFGHPDSDFASNDMELIAHAPILTDPGLFDTIDKLEEQGPFMAQFLADVSIVWHVLHGCFHNSGHDLSGWITPLLK